MLSESGEIILKNKQGANTFSDHFGSIVKKRGLDYWKDHSLYPNKGSARIHNIKRYKNHSSIKNIKVEFNSVRSFSFQSVSKDDVRKLFEI